MRILIVSGTFPPRKFGGVTASSFKLATSLKQQGHDVTVYTTDTGNDESHRLSVPFHNKMNGFDIYYFKNMSNWVAFKYRFHTPVGLIPMLNKINEESFDIIAIQDFRSFMSIVIHRICRRYNIPYIIQARGSLPYDEGNYLFKKLYDIAIGRKILREASKVIALSKTEVKQYINFGIEKNKIEIIPNGINVADYQALPDKGAFLQKNNFSPNEKIILSLGRLNKIKGIDLLLKAFAKVVNEISNVTLVIAGPDDGDLPRLKNLVMELKINEKVFFVGPLYGNDKLEAYCDATVFVLSSIYEVFGNTVIESLACGTPVIATSGCHIADVVSHAGIVVDYDADQLKDAILSLVKDENLAKNLGKKGRDLVFKQFDQDIIIDKVIQIYQECIRIR